MGIKVETSKLTLFKVLKAMAARVLFVLHSILAISRVWYVYEDVVYWCLGSVLFLIVAEGFMNIYFREGNETVGFCPCVFLYLCSVVPAVWLLELDLATHTPSISNSTSSGEELEGLIGSLTDMNKSSHASASLFATAVEQLLLVVLVMGRWLLPKGELTREELSQLLLVYVGTAADITELFETFKEPKVEGNMEIRYVILSLWSWSLLQFTIVVAGGSHARRSTGRSTFKQKHRTLAKYMDWWKWFTSNTDIWGIMISTCLQDGPFLVLRLYLMSGVGVISYMMIFFTCKNTLVLLLQMYRLAVIISERKKQLKTEKEEESLERIRTRTSMANDVTDDLENGASGVVASNPKPKPIPKPRKVSIKFKTDAQNGITNGITMIPTSDTGIVFEADSSTPSTSADITSTNVTSDPESQDVTSDIQNQSLSDSTSAPLLHYSRIIKLKKLTLETQSNFEL